MSWLQISLICIFVGLASQFSLSVEHQGRIPISFTSNLGFGNSTGSGASSAEMISFGNFINSGSAFYHDDVSQRMAYISDQMNKTYGNSPDYGYSIF